MVKKKSSLAFVSDDYLLNKIYLLREEKVMLDRDLAILYGVKSIRLREQVKRYLSSFPSHFMFQLSKQEVEIMLSQNAIPSTRHLGAVSIKIIELFV